MDTNTLSQAGGIYQWRQLSTNRRYIGSTNNFLKRYRDHLSALERRNHYNRHFNHAWHKYGATDFIFEILELVGDDSLLIEREQWYLDSVVNFSFDFNQAHEAAKGPSMKGKKQTRPRKKSPSPSPETIEKRAAKLRGKKRPPEVVERIKKSNSGKAKSEEHKTKLSEVNLRNGIKPPSDSVLSNESLSRKYAKGRKHTDETKEIIRQKKKAQGIKTFSGKTHTEESKKKMSERHTDVTLSEETKRKMSEAQRARRLSERLRRPGR